MTTNSGAAVLLGAMIIFAAGCASKHSPTDQPRPGSGIAEYRQITDTSIEAIQKALASLEVVVAQSNFCSAEALAGLSAEVQRLQVDSIQVRARTQAILARGDAYFERWHETMARVEDPEVRALAEERRPLLFESFQQIKRSSEQARAVFKPFLSGLRELRNSLERDPASLRGATARELVAQTSGGGRQLLEHLSRIRNELDSMKAMLTPGGTSKQDEKSK